MDVFEIEGILVYFP